MSGFAGEMGYMDCIPSFIARQFNHESELAPIAPRWVRRFSSYTFGDAYMYSVVMLMAMSQTPDLASFGGRNRGGCWGGNGCGGAVAGSCWGGNGCGGGRGGLFSRRGCGGGNGGACWGGNGCGGGRGGLFSRRNNGCCGAMANCGCAGYNAGCGCTGYVANNCGCCGAMASSGCWGGQPVMQMQVMPATTGGTTEKKEVIIDSFPVGTR